jgi:DNA-binding transcriptional regulator/RsmH inhibitor MraZ
MPPKDSRQVPSTSTRRCFFDQLFPRRGTLSVTVYAHEWAKFEAKVNGSPSMDGALQLFETFFLAAVAKLLIDQQGRVRLPTLLLKFLTSETVLVCRLDPRWIIDSSPFYRKIVTPDCSAALRMAASRLARANFSRKARFTYAAS